MKTLLFAFTAALLFSGNAWAHSSRYVVVQDIVAGGSGCVGGDFDARITSSGTKMILSFDEFVAVSGSGVPRSDSRKACSLALSLKAPHGWTYSLKMVGLKGRANLSRRDYGKASLSYRFQGDRSRESASKSLRGHYGRFSASFSDGDLGDVWAPCSKQRSLILKPSVRVRSRSRSYNDTYINLKEVAFKIKMKRCD